MLGHFWYTHFWVPDPPPLPALHPHGLCRARICAPLSDDATRVFGVSAFFSHHSAQYKRGARQVAVALVMTEPWLAPFVPMLRALAHNIVAPALPMPRVLAGAFGLVAAALERACAPQPAALPNPHSPEPVPLHQPCTCGAGLRVAHDAHCPMSAPTEVRGVVEVPPPPLVLVLVLAPVETAWAPRLCYSFGVEMKSVVLHCH